VARRKNMAQKRFTKEQIRKLDRIEDIRVAKGLPGYEDVIETLLSGLMERDGLSEEDLGESFAELLAACKFDENVLKKFNEENWPLEPVEPDEDEWEVFEYQFPKVTMIDQGLEQLQEMVVKGEIRLLTGSRRALKWIAEHPNAQLDHSIILPIPERVAFNQMVIPVFEAGYPHRRIINFRLVDTAAFQNFRWLVLRKKAEVVQVLVPAPAKESFDELLAACNFKYVNSGFIEANCPLEPVEQDEDEWEVAEYKMPENLPIWRALDRLKGTETKGKIRLLTGSRRALKWIAENIEKRLDHRIFLSLQVHIEGQSLTPVFGQENDRGVIISDGSNAPALLLFSQHSFPPGEGSCWLVLRKRQNPATK